MAGGFDVFLAIFLGVLLSLIAWSSVALRLVLRGRFDLVDIFLLTFGTIYGVGYAFVIYATQTGRNAAGFRVVGLEPFYWVIPVLALTCLCGGLVFTTFMGKSSDEGDRHGGGSDHEWRPALLALGWVFLTVSMLASTLYTRAYGGFQGFFEVSGALRAGLFEEAGANPLAFLKPFGGLSIFSTYVFAATWLTSGRNRRLGSFLGFFVSLIVSSFTLVGWGGRVDLLVYWMTLILGGLVYRAGVLPRLLGGAAALALVLAILLPPLTDAMNSGKSRESYLEFYAAEMTFPVESSLNSLSLSEYRYGLDIVLAPLFILPERIWGGLNIRNVSDINSEALLGDAPRDGFGYTIPADFVTFGLYQFGFAGPLILVIAWCYLLLGLDALLIRRVPRALSAFVYAHAIFSIAALSTLYVDPKMQIARNFHFILGMAAVLSLPWIWRMLIVPCGGCERRRRAP